MRGHLAEAAPDLRGIVSVQPAMAAVALMARLDFHADEHVRRGVLPVAEFLRIHLASGADPGRGASALTDEHQRRRLLRLHVAQRGEHRPWRVRASSSTSLQIDQHLVLARPAP